MHSNQNNIDPKERVLHDVDSFLQVGNTKEFHTGIQAKRVFQGVLSFVLIATFSLTIVLGLYMLSFYGLIEFFDFPLYGDFLDSPLCFTLFASSLACIVPPLFLIATKYGFFERAMRIFEIQGFLFLLLLVVLTVFCFIAMQDMEDMQPLLYVFYFAGITRLLLCVYMYVSIRLCICSQNMPIPSHVYEVLYAKEDSFKQENSQNLRVIENIHVETNKEEKKNKAWEKHILKKAWAQYSSEIPAPIEKGLFFAQLLGIVLMVLSLFPFRGLEAPEFTSYFSLFFVFFLYFYLLYQMRTRPYKVWYVAYCVLNVFIFVGFTPFENISWQAVLTLFFLFQCFIVWVIYRKGSKFFL